eukprot:TRINITY_DN4464_c0_g1_i1.p1 TRINITY_DN4464_c0_g1~~TRINITY_DN4464_c0_g1_i1.p1  ORF type:complete len:262 (-),score=74.57 TRINITY_DN4464_c0_g1_i1:31-816(-)
MPAVVEKLILPLELLTSPVFHGLENIPDEKPLLFVSNHSLLGLEMPILIQNLFRRKGIWLRGLGDHAHFGLPLWGDLMTSMGAVDGTRENCDLLLKAKECVLVYPGGANEVLKRKSDEKYCLKWGERLGFARMAISNQCTIIPTVCVGVEDMMAIVADLPISWIFGRKNLTLPIVMPPSPEKLQRIYFHFGKPVRTDIYSGDDGDENSRKVRDEVKSSIEQSLKDLQEFQKHDPYRLTKTRIESFFREMMTRQQQNTPTDE